MLVLPSLACVVVAGGGAGAGAVAVASVSHAPVNDVLAARQGPLQEKEAGEEE